MFKHNRINLAEYVARLTSEKPHLRQRDSAQAWLGYNLEATRMLRSRASTLTGLPDWVEPEDLQVLRYSTRGHYACHHDSSPDELESRTPVRLATLALFLNTPTEGGEIAFPAADHPNASWYTEDDWSRLESRYWI